MKFKIFFLAEVGFKLGMEAFKIITNYYICLNKMVHETSTKIIIQYIKNIPTKYTWKAIGIFRNVKPKVRI